MSGRMKKGDMALPESGADGGRLRIPGLSLDIRFVLVVIFLAALGLRLLYILDISGQVFFRQLVVDQAGYDQWAQAIAGGDWLGQTAFYQDPLYPYFLALIYAVFGRGLALVYVIQSLFTAASIFPLYGIGRRLFNDPRVGILAALFWALYKVSFFYDAQLLKTGPGLALIIFTLWLLVVCDERPRAALGLAAGFFSGLLFVFRGNFLLVIPVLFLWLCYSLWKRVGRTALPALMGFSAAAALVLGVVTVRNYLVSGELVITTTQGGVNFYVGNCRGNYWGAGKDPAFARRTPVFEQNDFTMEAERRAGRKLSPSQVDRFWYGEGWSEIEAAPGVFAGRLFRKTLLMVNRHEVSDNLNYYFFRDYLSFMLRLPWPAFWLAGPFGLAGAVLALKRRKGLMLFIFMISYGATLLAFYVVGRYRLPLVPALLVFAASGLTSLLDAVRARDRKDMVLYLAALLVFAAVGFPEWRKPSFDDSWQKMGHAYLREGDFSEAIDSYERALALNPGMAQAWLGLGLALEEKNRWDEGLLALQKAVSLDPGFAPAHYLLGRALERKGLWEAAAAEYETALKLDPDFSEAKKALEGIRERESALPR